MHREINVRRKVRTAILCRELQGAQAGEVDAGREGQRCGVDHLQIEFEGAAVGDVQQRGRDILQVEDEAQVDVEIGVHVQAARRRRIERQRAAAADQVFHDIGHAGQVFQTRQIEREVDVGDDVLGQIQVHRQGRRFVAEAQHLVLVISRQRVALHQQRGQCHRVGELQGQFQIAGSTRQAALRQAFAGLGDILPRREQVTVDLQRGAGRRLAQIQAQRVVTGTAVQPLRAQAGRSLAHGGGHGTGDVAIGLGLVDVGRVRERRLDLCIARQHDRVAGEIDLQPEGLQMVQGRGAFELARRIVGCGRRLLEQVAHALG